MGQPRSPRRTPVGRAAPAGAKDLRGMLDQALAELTRQRGVNTHLANEFARTQDERDRLRIENADLAAANRALTEERAALQADLERTRAKLSRRQSQLEEERASREHAIKDLERRDAQIDAIMRSPSWKLGAPLRTMGKLLAGNP